MITTEALALVRSQANIPASNTTFDTDINTYVQKALSWLFPVAMADIDPDTTKYVNSDGRTIDLPTGTVDVGDLELYDTETSDYRPISEFRLHGTKIKLDSYCAPGTQARIWGLGSYAITASSGTTTLPAYLDMVIVYWALSMLYASFAGNKRKYNQYVSASGAVGDRDMKDSVDFFKNMGNDLLIDRVGIKGA